MSSKDALHKMQFFGTIKKLSSLFPRLQNAKWQKTPTDSTVIAPKHVQIPRFLHIPRALEQGQICIYGFMRKIWLGKKVLLFHNLSCTGKNPNHNCFRVPIHFAANRFTFEKFPPPPPLLHPIYTLYPKTRNAGRDMEWLRSVGSIKL